MKHVAATAAVLGFLLNLATARQVDPKRWVEAERAIRRIAPQDYQGLPRPIARYLQSHGYTIPQPFDSEEQRNVVRGHFDDDQTLDWAVLASRESHSQILVFWGGTAARVTAMARWADTGYLQVMGERIAYSRSLSVVGREYIVAHYRAYGGPKPPAIRHDAINDCFLGKASEVHYFDGSRWHQLQGAD